jgi:hypothetical protein
MYNIHAHMYMYMCMYMLCVVDMTYIWWRTSESSLGLFCRYPKWKSPPFKTFSRGAHGTTLGGTRVVRLAGVRPMCRVLCVHLGPP